MWGSDECDCAEAPKGDTGPVVCICIEENDCTCTKECECMKCSEFWKENKYA